MAIQARSTSKRFPNKALAILGTKTLIEHVVTAAEEAVGFLQRNLKDPLEFVVAVLVPDRDPLVDFLDRKSHCKIVEGDEFNVLSRYEKAVVLYRPDFIVRLTGDCPLLPDFVISKHVRSALFGSMDYVSNVDPRFRTSPDGWDVEVMSKRLFSWVAQTANKMLDLEHVTTLIRREPPDWARIGHVIDHIDNSSVKLSVDTPEDLERVREQYTSVSKKVELAKTYRPQTVTFRL